MRATRSLREIIEWVVIGGIALVAINGAVVLTTVRPPSFFEEPRLVTESFTPAPRLGNGSYGWAAPVDSEAEPCQNRRPLPTVSEPESCHSGHLLPLVRDPAAAVQPRSA